MGVLQRKSAAPGVNTTGAHFGRSLMSGHNDGEIPHSGCSSAYKILLGRPSLNAIRAIPSAYHMVIKFPTANGVRMVRGDQRIARECYSASMKQKAVGSIYMDELDMRDEMSTRPTPSKELEPIQLDEQPEHLVYIIFKLARDVRDLLIHFLKHNMEVFAWKQEDMGGIDSLVITHRLNIAPPSNLSSKKE